MASKPKEGGEAPKDEPERTFTYRRVGHKGADAIVAGNTAESFDVAVENGVDMIELDVLREREGRLIVAHDFDDATRAGGRWSWRTRSTLFLEPPLDKVEIDCDLKLAGREAELAGALEGRGLIDRAMVSTKEIESLHKLRQLEHRTCVSAGPTRRPSATGPSTAGPPRRSRRRLATLRRRYPSILAKRGPALDVNAVWVYHPIITPKAVEAARQIGVELIAWTVDDVTRMRELLEMGVDGICSNDPRLFEVVEGRPHRAPLRAKRD